MTPSEACARLLALLGAVEWKFSERARREGTTTLSRFLGHDPTDCEMIDYITQRLRSGVLLRCQPQGDPPGSTGDAWQFTDANNVFVKMRIQELRIGKEEVYIQSIHFSVYSPGASGS